MGSIFESELFDAKFVSDWHMTLAERCAFLQILNHRKPSVSIEIGTFHGGSLRPLAELSETVYSFDIDPNQHRLSPLFPNVNFITGDTRETLPGKIDELNESGALLGFVLVDGSHTEAGVTSDIENILRFIPVKQPLVIVMHDSCNPEVRSGILKADWERCGHVHGLSLDFVPGMLYDRPDIKDQFWGGLAVAILMPEVRTEPLVIQQDFQYSRNIMMRFTNGNASN